MGMLAYFKHRRRCRELGLKTSSDVLRRYISNLTAIHEHKAEAEMKEIEKAGVGMKRAEAIGNRLGFLRSRAQVLLDDTAKLSGLMEFLPDDEDTAMLAAHCRKLGKGD